MTKLDKLLGEINREHVYIQTHNFPDPDAIASAYGLQKLLELRGVRATICYIIFRLKYNYMRLKRWLTHQEH